MQGRTPFAEAFALSARGRERAGVATRAGIKMPEGKQEERRMWNSPKEPCFISFKHQHIPAHMRALTWVHVHSNASWLHWLCTGPSKMLGLSLAFPFPLHLPVAAAASWRRNPGFGSWGWGGNGSLFPPSPQVLSLSSLPFVTSLVLLKISWDRPGSASKALTHAVPK